MPGEQAHFRRIEEGEEKEFEDSEKPKKKGKDIEIKYNVVSEEATRPEQKKPVEEKKNVEIKYNVVSEEATRPDKAGAESAEQSATLESEEVNPIAAAETWEDLDTALSSKEGIEGSKDFFPAEDLKQIIADVRGGKRDIMAVTRSEGLRDKVLKLLGPELMAAEERQKRETITETTPEAAPIKAEVKAEAKEPIPEEFDAAAMESALEEELAKTKAATIKKHVDILNDFADNKEPGAELDIHKLVDDMAALREIRQRVDKSFNSKEGRFKSWVGRWKDRINAVNSIPSNTIDAFSGVYQEIKARTLDRKDRSKRAREANRKKKQMEKARGVLADLKAFAQELTG